MQDGRLLAVWSSHDGGRGAWTS